MEDGWHMNRSNFTIYKPNLSLFGISENDKFNISEVHIWIKCIKSKIYKKAVNLLGNRYFYLVNWAEDTSMVFLLFNIAVTYKYVTKYLFLYIIEKIKLGNLCLIQINYLEKYFFSYYF